jgi:hypothetical protein
MSESEQRITLRLPRELWDVLKHDREVFKRDPDLGEGLVRVMLDYEPKINHFVCDLIQERFWGRPDPANFESSAYPFRPGKRIQLSIRLETGLYKKFRKYCIEAGTTMNKTIMEWLWQDEAVQAALKRHRYI